MKKLLTKDQELIKEVENVLKTKNVKFVTYDIGDADNKSKIIAVLNRNGNALCDAVNEKAAGKKYHLGVLRNHPECATPQNLINKLLEE